MNLDAVTAAYGEANCKAFLRVIRERESSQDDSAYTVINGGSHFTAPPWRHPWHGIPTTQGARASGAYQYLGTTWARVAEALGFGEDFSPINQDLGAVYLIAGRGALSDVLSGRVAEACVKLRPEWTSLPGAAEASPNWTMDKVREVFVRWGGTLAEPLPEQPAAPIEDVSHQAAPATLPTQGADMGAGMVLGLAQAILGAFAPLAQEKLARELGRHADKPEVAQQAAQAILDAAMTATGIKEPIQAAAAVQAAAPTGAKPDPVLVAQVQASALDRFDKLKPMFDQLTELDKMLLSAGVAGRDAAKARAIGDTYDVAPVMVKNVTMTSNWLLAGLVAATIVSIVVKAMFKELPDYVPMILPVLGLLAGQISKERGAIISYRFDGTPSSNAANAINAEISRTSGGGKA